MAWIEVHQSLPTHRKTLALCDILNIEPVQAVGHLTCLWMWALDNAPDGGLERITAKPIARAAQWRKDPQTFVDALVQAGFVDAPGHLHDWDDYTWRLREGREDNRARARERQRRFRERQRAVTGDSNARERDSNALLERDERENNRATVPNRTQPNRTVPNQTKKDESVSLRSTGSGKKPRAAPGNSRVAAYVDAYRAFCGEHEPPMCPRDAAAIKRSTAPPELIAETYRVIKLGQWGTEFQRNNLCVHSVVGWVNAYALWREERGLEPFERRHDPGLVLVSA